MGQALQEVELISDEGLMYINSIHGNSKGWITKAEINEGTFKQWHYKLNDLLEANLRFCCKIAPKFVQAQ